MNELNKATKDFVEKLRSDENVLGVILFGSWARGNNRPDSDVDLVVILKEGYQRCVETHENQVFEIIYTTEQGALDFWKSHLDDAFGLWDVAKILIDKDGVMEKLKNKITDVLEKGKPQISKLAIEQFRFDAEDQVDYAEKIKESDITTSKLILNNKVFNLSSVYFDLRQKYIPAPKQRLSVIKKEDSELYDKYVRFYENSDNPSEQIRIARDIINIVFQIAHE
jgi:hypothetical protein